MNYSLRGGFQAVYEYRFKKDVMGNCNIQQRANAWRIVIAIIIIIIHHRPIFCKDAHTKGNLDHKHTKMLAFGKRRIKKGNPSPPQKQMSSFKLEILNRCTLGRSKKKMISPLQEIGVECLNHGIGHPSFHATPIHPLHSSITKNRN